MKASIMNMGAHLFIYSTTPALTFVLVFIALTWILSPVVARTPLRRWISKARL